MKSPGKLGGSWFSVYRGCVCEFRGFAWRQDPIIAVAYLIHQVLHAACGIGVFFEMSDFMNEQDVALIALTHTSSLVQNIYDPLVKNGNHIMVQSAYFMLND